MGKVITNAPQGIVLLLMRNSLYGVHIVIKLSVQASTSVLEEATNEEDASSIGSNRV